MKLRHPFLFAMVLAIGACEKESECANTLLETESIENEYGCENVKIDFPGNVETSYLVIRNQQGYEMYVSAACDSPVDFSVYDLLIGTEELTNGLDSIEFELVETCETGTVILTVTFQLASSTVAPTVFYHALIPKLPDDQELTVEIVKS